MSCWLPGLGDIPTRLHIQVPVPELYLRARICAVPARAVIYLVRRKFIGCLHGHGLLPRLHPPFGVRPPVFLAGGGPGADRLRLLTCGLCRRGPGESDFIEVSAQLIFVPFSHTLGLLYK